jgi:hypothetical protein
VYPLFAQVMAKELCTTQEWVDIESAKLPHFSMENLFNYFVERHVSDGANPTITKM